MKPRLAHTQPGAHTAWRTRSPGRTQPGTCGLARTHPSTLTPFHREQSRGARPVHAHGSPDAVERPAVAAPRPRATHGDNGAEQSSPRTQAGHSRWGRPRRLRGRECPRPHGTPVTRVETRRHVASRSHAREAPIRRPVRPSPPLCGGSNPISPPIAARWSPLRPQGSGHRGPASAARASST